MKRGGKSDNKLRRAWVAAIPDHCVAVAWSADGRLVAAAAVSGPVAVYAALTGQAVHQLAGHGFGTTAIAFHPSRPLLATAGQDGQVRLWDATSGTESAKFAGGAAWVEHLAWNADGSVLATAAGKKVRLWGATGIPLREYVDHGGTLADLAWKPGTNLLSVAAYGGVTLYDPTQTGSVRRYEWKGAPLRLAWSPNGKLLAHGNQDASVHFWFADSGKDLEMPGYPTKVRELSWDAAGRLLATGGGPAVVLWDCGGANGPAGSKPQLLMDGEDEASLAAVGWQRRGYLLATAGHDGRVLVWQPANKKAPLVGQDQLDSTEATVLAWSPDDKMLAVGGASGAVALYRVG